MSLISEGADFRGRLAAGRGLDLAEPSSASVGDYIALLKPRVMSLVVFTALTGLVCADRPLNPILAAVAVLCIAVGAGAREVEWAVMAMNIYSRMDEGRASMPETRPQALELAGAG